MLTTRYRVYQAGIKEQVVEMAINGSGIRDTARVLKIDKNTIISTLNTLVQVNPKLSELSADGGLEVRLEVACEVEMDEQWSYIGNKSN